MKYQIISSGRRFGKTTAANKYKALVQRFIEENPPSPKATATEILARDKLFADFMKKNEAEL
jgi:hypothetical protein